MILPGMFSGVYRDKKAAIRYQQQCKRKQVICWELLEGILIDSNQKFLVAYIEYVFCNVVKLETINVNREPPI